MKSTYRTALVVLLVMNFLTNPVLLAWGNPVPGRWEKVAETKPGEKINIYTKDGVIQNCRYVSINDEFLTCSNKDGDRHQFELETVNEVIVPKAGKYAKHGALWGAAGGAGVGAGLLGIWEDLSDIHILIVPIAFAGLGAGVGFLTGAAVGAPGETVYISKEAALAEAK